MRRICIPGLVDVVRLDEPAHIAAWAEDPRLDRDFAGTGPLLNRLICGRIQRVLQVSGRPLPSVAPREHPGRAEGQAALAARLDSALAGGIPAVEQLHLFAAYIRGEISEAALGPAAQEAIGRLFAAGYRADSTTWRAARVLDTAPRNFNPLRAIAWWLTRAVARARTRLARAVHDDPAGVHATAFAVHSLVRSLRAMRDVWRDSDGRLAAEEAVIRSLRAPETVIRRCSAASSTAIGNVPAGALAMLELETARRHEPGPKIVFMSGSWSRCPAQPWCMALLRAAWEHAAAQRRPA